ncbi:MAG: low molecular weight phosphotyrosine protein phosphatase [Sulfurospirillum sp.]|nr:MAG: low molecular weight phosphotyrosine protein phosphatase [Sulfurospirillum sp.]
MKSILFVCLGNICRSPLAEGIAAKIAADHNLDLKIDSAGTAHWHIGKPPCENSIKIAALNGIDISALRARQLQEADKNFSHIVAMDSQNYKDLLALGFKNPYLIGDYGELFGEDIPDPYFFDGFEGFHKVYAMLDRSIQDFMKKERLWV